MLTIKRVTMKDGATLIAIKDRTTGKTVRNIDGPGFAYFLTLEHAEARIEDYIAYFEKMAM